MGCSAGYVNIVVSVELHCVVTSDLSLSSAPVLDHTKELSTFSGFYLSSLLFGQLANVDNRVGVCD